ncbi:MAG TPA: hypothetical protein VJ124_23170 [Pyrinomonadaceae bacterium]|nr:hypothetical protein [Pyrinomonadaceae bacterium]
MAINHNQVFNAATNVNLNKRLEDTGWGLFLIVIGATVILRSLFTNRN